MHRTRALLGALVLSVAFLHPTAWASGAGTVHTDEVCLATHNPGDRAPQAMYGVRYWTRTPTAATRTIVLVHGVTTTAVPGHAYWDLAPDLSVARNLARAGYLVLAYDRLGYERSPYRTGSGHDITVVGDQAMLHDVVQDVHHGTWTAATDGACDATRPGPPAGSGSASVIIVGNSLGGGIVNGYPGRFHDVDAAIPVGWANSAPAPYFFALVGQGAAQALAAGADRIALESTESDCTKVYLYPPGVAPAGRDFCRGAPATIPIGEIEQFPAAYPTNLSAIANVAPGLPVLLVFNERDTIFTADQAEAEYEYWDAVCDCDVSTWTQAGAGHGPVAHRTMPTFTAKVIDWLASRRLGPR